MQRLLHVRVWCCPGVANRTHSRSSGAFYIPSPACAHSEPFFERLIHETSERRCNEFSRYSCVVCCDVLFLVIFIHVPFLKGRKFCHDIAMKSVLCFSALILVDQFWQNLLWTLCNFRPFQFIVFKILQCIMTVCQPRKLVTWDWP
jgi:hypothetical protein